MNLRKAYAILALFALTSCGSSGEIPKQTQAEPCPPAVAQREQTDDEIIEDAALTFGVNPSILRAQMQVESRRNPRARSPKGARGLMQIMPANAKRCGLRHADELWKKRPNIFCGAQIIGEEIRERGNLVLALKVYNGGPDALKKRFKETEQYVGDVLALVPELSGVAKDLTQLSRSSRSSLSSS